MFVSLFPPHQKCVNEAFLLTIHFVFALRSNFCVRRGGDRTTNNHHTFPIGHGRLDLSQYTTKLYLIIEKTRF